MLITWFEPQAYSWKNREVCYFYSLLFYVNAWTSSLVLIRLQVQIVGLVLVLITKSKKG